LEDKPDTDLEQPYKKTAKQKLLPRNLTPNEAKTLGGEHSRGEHSSEEKKVPVGGEDAGTPRAWSEGKRWCPDRFLSNDSQGN